MIITSMNLYEFSEKTNREMGILIDKAGDKKLYEEGYAECMSIIRAAQLKFSPKSPAKLQPPVVEQTVTDKPPAKPQKQVFVEQAVTEPQKGGFCIRCGIEIPSNPDEPYCKNCFVIWAKYENSVYAEKYCHHCKKNRKTSMAKPLCFSCYKAK